MISFKLINLLKDWANFEWLIGEWLVTVISQTCLDILMTFIYYARYFL